MPPRKKKKEPKKEPKKKPQPKPRAKGKKIGQLKKPPAITRKDHVKDAPEIVGSEERMSDAILFVWSKRRQGYSYESIAKLCTHEPLSLSKEPSLSTIANWITKGRQIVNEMLKEEVEAERETMKAWVGQLVEKFLPLAIEDSLAVNRKQMIDGEWTTVLDENAFEEQHKAGGLVIKAVKQMAALYGFDKPKEGDKFNLTNIHLQMIQNINRNMNPESTKVVELHGVTLELTTGIDGIS